MATRVATVFLAVYLAIGPELTACSVVIGHFYQVRSLRGRVVGVNWHQHWYAPLQYVRWLRQSFNGSGASLTLYEYRWPFRSWSELVEAARMTADKNGNFDFGANKKAITFL